MEATERRGREGKFWIRLVAVGVPVLLVSLLLLDGSRDSSTLFLLLLWLVVGLLLLCLLFREANSFLVGAVLVLSALAWLSFRTVSSLVLLSFAELAAVWLVASLLSVGDLSGALLGGCLVLLLLFLYLLSRG